MRRAAVQGAGTGSVDEASSPGKAAGAAAGGFQLSGTKELLDSDVFWFATQKKDRFKVNLLDAYPPLRALLRRWGRAGRRGVEAVGWKGLDGGFVEVRGVGCKEGGEGGGRGQGLPVVELWVCAGDEVSLVSWSTGVPRVPLLAAAPVPGRCACF